MIEKIGEKHHLERAWFRNSLNDIELGRNIGFGVRKSKNTGAIGFVTGEEAEVVAQTANEIADLIGAEIYKSNLP